MKITPTEIPDVLLIEPRVFEDDRGYFFESYHFMRYSGLGVPSEFVQDNVSFSSRNVLRGLHYQLRQPQGKLVSVLSGEIYDVAVDIRRGSRTFGRWVASELSSENHRQVYIPEGFAHGFCVVSPTATVLYKCTDYYAPEDDRGIRWDDPALAIRWPAAAPILSEKDNRYPTLAHLPVELLPPFRRAT